MNARAEIATAALELAAEGFRVFPIPGARKSPPIKGWQKWATVNVEKIRQHWSASPTDNIGIACGDGLLVLDVDGEAGAQSLAKLELIHGKLPETCKVSTPSGGSHYYFAGPDVSNSAGKLGAGLDVRSAGGYVVGPGSITEKGTYVVAHAADLAPAPSWLVDLCSKPRENSNTGEPVPDAPASAVERAREWLAAQPPAIEGQGGDAHTFATACSLRDLGLSESQTVDLLAGEWNDRCAPPWALADLQTKAANAYTYAENEAGVRAALPSDFEILPETAAVIGKARRTKGASVHEFARRLGDGRGYLVKGLLERRSYAVMYGEPGAGKSFLALDLAYHVAAGKPWRDRRVIGGPVLYLAFEGTGGISKRAAALEQHYGNLAGVPLMIEPASWNLLDPTDRKAFAERVAEIMADDFSGKHPALVVVDTLARAFRGDENSAKDMGAFNSTIGDLAERTGAGILVLHHSGKNKAAGARGSSALLGAVDTELEVDGWQLKATKQRDIELGAPVAFELHPVFVGEDADGDPMLSCVVVGAHGAARRTWKPTGKAAIAWTALCALGGDSNASVSLDDWTREFRDKAYPTGAKESTARMALDRAIGALRENGMVHGPAGGPWRRAFAEG